MTPAERLIAAADLLEKAAGEATEGPWEAGEFCVWTTADVEDGVIVSDGPDGGAGASEENARYIAMMHPGVARALAAWLRHEGQGAAAGLGVINPTLALADLVLAGEQEQG